MSVEHSDRSVELTSFAAWYEETRPRVRASVFALCRDLDLADEIVVADAYTKAYEKWDRVSRMDSPRQWVITVAINRLKRSWRRRALERARTGHAPDTVPEVEGVDIALWRLVSQLPDRQREAVVLRYIGDLREADVAKHLGLSPGGASALLSKARRRLRDQIESERNGHDY